MAKKPSEPLERVLPYAEERYGSRSLQRRYTCDHLGVRRVRTKEHGIWAAVQKFVKEAFLPQGYPESVSDDYLPYQVWDTMQAFCSSITGSLATLEILKGVGVGDSSATPLAASITWMLKDGTGMLGRILFAWMQGTDLDCNAKRWRLAADFLSDFGTFLELLAPLFPYFLLLVCAASISKAIVGIAGGATRAALVQHQARRDNMADVSAKDNSQETLVNLVALLINLVLTPAVAGKTGLIWLLFLVFTFLHLFANHQAVSMVNMETLNKNRLHIAMSDYLSIGKVPSPTSTNAREPILGWSARVMSYTLGAPLDQVIHSASVYEAAVTNHQKGKKYVINFSRSKRKAAVAFHEDSEATDQLEAAFVVEFLDYVIQHKSISMSPLLSQYSEFIRDLKDRPDDGEALAIYISSVVEAHSPSLLATLEQSGWVISHHLLRVEEWRHSWQGDTQLERTS